MGGGDWRRIGVGKYVRVREEDAAEEVDEGCHCAHFRGPGVVSFRGI